jgi:hypothetical protein
LAKRNDVAIARLCNRDQLDTNSIHANILFYSTSGRPLIILSHLSPKISAFVGVRDKIYNRYLRPEIAHDRDDHALQSIPDNACDGRPPRCDALVPQRIGDDCKEHHVVQRGNEQRSVINTRHVERLHKKSRAVKPRAMIRGRLCVAGHQPSDGREPRARLAPLTPGVERRLLTASPLQRTREGRVILTSRERACLMQPRIGLALRFCARPPCWSVNECLQSVA